MEWNIGEKAQQWDEKSVSERMKVEKRSLKKVIVALGIYFVVIGIFAIML